jgi:hypothetical protein
MTLKEFRKLSENDRGTFVGASVSTLAYYYAANGEKTRARCVYDWYFGKGEQATGVREIALEMGIAEKLDPEKFQAEGIILGVVEKACSVAHAK